MGLWAIQIGRTRGVAKSLRSGRLARRAGIDISEIRRRSEVGARTRRMPEGFPLWVVDGRKAEDLTRVTK